jgi:hypothetical protein
MLYKPTLGIQLKNIQYRTMFTISNTIFYTKTIICKPILVNIITRNMHRSRDTIVRTTYSLLEKLLEPNILNSMSKNDKKIFLNVLWDYSFNPNDGVLQHKASLIHQMFRDKYSSNIFKEIYLSRHPDSKVVFPKDILIDLRIFAEVPVIARYEKAFSPNIMQILLTGDSIPTTLDKQDQTNPDGIVDLVSPLGVKRTYQDVKSGVVKHYTRGSLDMITFDSNRQVIPFTSQPYNLYEMNKKRLQSIKNGLIQDGNSDTPFDKVIEDCKNILNTEQDIFTGHERIQNHLWKEIQCHPRYNRSVAFTFVEHQSPMVITDKYTTYHNKFVSLLGDRKYNTNEMGDRLEIFRAMLRSYREVDPHISKKFDHLKDIDVKIDQHFLHVISQLIKQTLI